MWGEGNKLQFVEVGIYQSYGASFNKTNLKQFGWDFSYGASIYHGSYDLKHIAPYQGKKSLWGVSATNEYNLKFSYKFVELKWPGWRIDDFDESVPYSRFRKKAHADSIIINLHSSNYFITVSGTSELIFKIN